MKTKPPFFLVGRVGWGKELFPVSACLQEYGLSSTTPTTGRSTRSGGMPCRDLIGEEISSVAVYLWRIAPWWDRRGGGWNIPRPVAASSDTPLSSTTPTSRRVPRPPPAPSRGRAVSGDSQGEAVLLRKQDLRGVSQVRPRSSGLLPGECIDGASPPPLGADGEGDGDAASVVSRISR